ncbi:MAG: thioredoxin domain-containing protein, partial [Pyrinomonadaceae bacterium]|nr:thioredoxin domain-containing protein [Pyrinomonadaceae bacterium]
DWHGWNDEALQKAVNEDKPVLLSIGYSACHWCHVMEHESFQDERIAKIMNENFVNIKVDMEERPDIDKIYMNFVQLTTGSGGWPLTVFLTPDQKPFFGGTYFPPQPRSNMPSFEQILLSIQNAWQDKRDEIMNSADDILAELRRVGKSESSGEEISAELLESAFLSFEKTYDRANGGFGGAPKFPPPMALEFLLRYHYRTGNEEALNMVVNSCRKMALGGINDQLGGGFHRYAVDATWLTPHFEKMLYDNAQLAGIYLHVFQITKDEFYKKIAVETLEYVKREMLDDHGGFYSAQDADSEGVEGKFFVWTPEEVKRCLGDDAAPFLFYYDISDDGNFEGKNILNIKNSMAETAKVFGKDIADLKKLLEKSKEKLFTEREKRVKPFRDEKIITAWNGLMLKVFAEASAVIGSEEYLSIAKNNADFVIEKMQKDGRLLRTWKDGSAKLDAYLEDYSNFADGLFELYQVSGEIKYLEESKRLADLMISDFWDEGSGGFYFTSNDHEELLIRSKDYLDNATPSGNSAAVDIFLRLSKILGDENYRRFATTVLRLTVPQMIRYPGAFGRSLAASEYYLGSVKEIVIIGERMSELESAIWKDFVPNKVVAVSADPENESEFLPILKDRQPIGDKPTAYVCENFTCQKPVTDVDTLMDQLAR